VYRYGVAVNKPKFIEKYIPLYFKTNDTLERFLKVGLLYKFVSPVLVYRFSQNLSLQISLNGSNLTAKHFTHHMGIYSGSICRNWCIQFIPIASKAPGLVTEPLEPET
jgi:hypothetical protein